MPVLFISHSSQDDPHADALTSWLKTSGFTDIFCDHNSVAGGDKWREGLRASANACRVVIFLVTEDWLASSKCFGEFEASWLMGKRLIPLFLLPGRDALGDEARKRLTTVKGEDQGLDIAPCVAPDGTFDLGRDGNVAERFKIGLRAAGANTDVGLDPEAFVIDRNLRNTPFPGLASFGDADADAALFYGRSGEIAETLEILRKMRACPVDRPLFILGASGAGKSSLLMAGIIPRLRRETPAWLPLRAFRPGADPMRSFAEALARTLADYNGREAPGDIHDRLFAVWSMPEHRSPEGLTDDGLVALSLALEAEGGRLRKAADRPGSTILISVDQAEEIARADGESGEALADYLRAAQASKASRWQLAFTIRSDSFPELQAHRCFQDLKGLGYDLRAIPTFRFENLVEKPARRYGAQVDPALITALMDGAPKDDTLPLLAFALHRLWRQYGATGQLTKANYESVGALKGLIEDAAERALRGIAPGEDRPLKFSPPTQHRDELGAATFVPAMAQLNDEGATIRRVANWREFGEESRELLRRFDDWRLVVRKEQNGGTVEVAHEALFREWTRLKSWLEPERARLEALRSLQLDAAAWDRTNRNSELLLHRGARLSAAEDLLARERYAEHITQLERDYLEAARALKASAIAAEAARAAREHAGNRTRKRMQAVVMLLLAGTIVGLVGWMNQSVIAEQWHWQMTVRPYIKENMAPHILTAEAERAMKPGDKFRECAEKCPEMVVLPDGVFTMGSPDGKTSVIRLDGKSKPGPLSPAEEGRSDNEGPQHEVKIARFAVGKFEVTFDDWEDCVALGGCPAVSDSGWGGDGRRPVINVSWDEAKRYVAWLSRLTGKQYRLLTEAEWEYAARAGTSTAYSFGDDPREMCKHANLADLSLEKAGRSYQTVDFCDDGSSVTAPVGTYAANPYGLHDMHGNVWEWTEDCYAGSSEGASPEGCSLRVLRGGSWFDDPQFLRAAYRSRNSPGYRGDVIGFRLSRTLNP